MIIDFHTHTFPEKIAARTMAYLSEKANVKPHRDGTMQSLKESMKKSGIDFSVVLPIATSPKQVHSINTLSAELNGKDGLIYAGSVHPDTENVEEVLDYIKESGLFGIKVHPDYQGIYFDDPRYIKIIGEAAKRDLIVVTHAGNDAGFPDDIHCTPDMVLHVLDELEGIIDNKLVLAHMGGCDLPDEVLEKLVGKPVYFDTSFVLDRYHEKCKRIIEAHGFDKILFATDSPWSGQKEFVACMKEFGFSEEQEEMIFYKNAEKLVKNSIK